MPKTLVQKRLSDYFLIFKERKVIEKPKEISKEQTRIQELEAELSSSKEKLLRHIIKEQKFIEIIRKRHQEVKTIVKCLNQNAFIQSTEDVLQFHYDKNQGCCSICKETIPFKKEEIQVTSCGHFFCKECLNSYHKDHDVRRCPGCRKVLNIKIKE